MLLGEVGGLEERQREFIREIMGKGVDLLNLIDNILNIHKVQSGLPRISGNSAGAAAPARSVQ